MAPPRKTPAKDAPAPPIPGHALRSGRVAPHQAPPGRIGKRIAKARLPVKTPAKKSSVKKITAKKTLAKKVPVKKTPVLAQVEEDSTLTSNVEYEAETEEEQQEDNGGDATMINHEDGDGDQLIRTTFSKYANYVAFKGVKDPVQRLTIINMLKDDERKEGFHQLKLRRRSGGVYLEFCHCKIMLCFKF
ncbi:uncharacterized protein K444DRAFT_616259 [Hyaloscypha bicolor E]|uniref:Uncharacterized protein n=1 Tax=Hyaloscypha bicolor E TaxID=1095630 RepID=A0A2J6T086_9HELO|nr:uncharacterized protein K444DRAFT_616259 [Hyaloscypha bicolor E]PMD56427.1 hypothetical protein K444DRAFT_616259 [Hyaloscypha bicolor E]